MRLRHCPYLVETLAERARHRPGDRARAVGVDRGPEPLQEPERTVRVCRPGAETERHQLAAHGARACLSARATRGQAGAVSCGADLASIQQHGLRAAVSCAARRRLGGPEGDTRRGADAFVGGVSHLAHRRSIRRCPDKRSHCNARAIGASALGFWMAPPPRIARFGAGQVSRPNRRVSFLLAPGPLKTQPLIEPPASLGSTISWACQVKNRQKPLRMVGQLSWESPRPEPSAARSQSGNGRKQTRQGAGGSSRLGASRNPERIPDPQSIPSKACAIEGPRRISIAFVLHGWSETVSATIGTFSFF